MVSRALLCMQSLNNCPGAQIGVFRFMFSRKKPTASHSGGQIKQSLISLDKMNTILLKPAMDAGIITHTSHTKKGYLAKHSKEFDFKNTYAAPWRARSLAADNALFR